jgi:hypothetical protein
MATLSVLKFSRPEGADEGELRELFSEQPPVAQHA